MPWQVQLPKNELFFEGRLLSIAFTFIKIYVTWMHYCDWHNTHTITDIYKKESQKKKKSREKKNGYTYGKRVVYIPYWSEYGPGLGVFVFTFEPDVVVELVWCGGPCNTRKSKVFYMWSVSLAVAMVFVLWNRKQNKNTTPIAHNRRFRVRCERQT